jgi:hypothetical protein
VKTSPATDRAAQHRRGGQARQRALTQHIVVLFLFIKLKNYFIYFEYYHLSSNANCFVSVCRHPLPVDASAIKAYHCTARIT